MRSPALGSLLATTLLLASGCDEGVRAQDGPLSFGEGEGSICLERSAGAGEYTFGNEVLSVEAGARVRITRVALEGAEGVDLRESYVVPIAGQTLVGLAPGWPPAEASSWPPLAKAEGSSVASSDGDTNLVLRLELTVAEARFASVSIDYQADGQKYRAQSRYSVEVAARCSP